MNLLNLKVSLYSLKLQSVATYIFPLSSYSIILSAVLAFSLDPESFQAFLSSRHLMVLCACQKLFPMYNQFQFCFKALRRYYCLKVRSSLVNLSIYQSKLCRGDIYLDLRLDSSYPPCFKIKSTAHCLQIVDLCCLRLLQQLSNQGSHS